MNNLGIIKNVFSIVIVLLFLSSCNKESVNTIDEITSYRTNSDEIELEYLAKQIGIIHNKGLNSVYNELLDSTNNNLLQISDMETVYYFSERATNRFIDNSNEYFIVSNIDICKEYIGLVYDSIFTVSQNNLCPKEFSHLLTEKQEELLSILNKVLIDTIINYENTQIVFEEIRIRAINEYDENELFMVLVAVEVGKNSLAYWYSNAYLWAGLSNMKDQSVDWRMVGKADIAGALGSGAAVGVTALVTPVTAAVAAAVIVGGGLGASVTAGVLSWWG